MFSFTRNYKAFFQHDWTIYTPTHNAGVSWCPQILVGLLSFSHLSVWHILFHGCIVLHGVGAHKRFSCLPVDGHGFVSGSWPLRMTLQEASLHLCPYTCVLSCHEVSELKDTYISAVRRYCQVVFAKVVVLPLLLHFPV